MKRRETRYEFLDKAGRELSHAEIKETIRQLARDDRFAAVVAWVERSSAEWAIQAADPRNAENHGRLASYAGGLGGVLRLQGHLREILNARPEAPPPSPGD